jgi:hypothetical protein
MSRKNVACHCYETYSSLPAGRVTVFTIDGLRHAVPSYWIIGRLQAGRSDAGPIPVYHEWAWACTHGREDEQ